MTLETTRQPSPLQRRLLGAAVATWSSLFALLGIARYQTFHNETFDLAFYSRIAWGFVRLSFWEPMTNAHFYGLHVSPILIPFGALGALFDTPTTLLVGQSLALGLAAFPIARVGVRHLGPNGGLIGGLAWLLYPNLAHVAGYEFHPGSLAVLPLAWMAYAIDRADVRAFMLGALGVLLCREDLALVVLFASAAFVLRDRARWKIPTAIGVGSMLYALYFLLVLHPMHAPTVGSLQLHFGEFGQSVPEVAVHLLTHPGDLVSHLSTTERLTYLPKILLPLGLLPLLRPRWFVPILPILGVNLISAWPTATDLSVHYLTPAVPFLVIAALDGAGRLRTMGPKIPPAVLAALIAAPTLIAHVVAGGTPLSVDFDAAAYRSDERSEAARAIVQRVPEGASVQAPYPLLAHLADRQTLHRAPPTTPEANDAYFVLDLAHRRRFHGSGDLLRTVEEPTAREWLARDDHVIEAAVGDFVLLRRGGDPRAGVAAEAIVARVDPTAGVMLTSCLAVRDARFDSETLVLRFVASGPCPSDLALRIGVTNRPDRIELLFGGLLSPAHLRRGDVLESRHALPTALRESIAVRGLRLGLVRSSGARPEPSDPDSVAVTVD